MQELEQSVRKLEKLDLGEVALIVVRNEAVSTVIPLNIDQLYERGIDSEGNSLGEYSPFTIKQKQRKGQRFDHVTTRDEGDFHDAFYAETESWPVDINSKDPKTDKLVDTYGKLFGLTKQSTEELNDQIEKELIEACEAAIISCLP